MVPSTPLPGLPPHVPAAPAAEARPSPATNAARDYAAGARALAALADRVAVLGRALAHALETGDEHAVVLLHEQIAKIERFLETVSR